MNSDVPKLDELELQGGLLGSLDRRAGPLGGGDGRKVKLLGCGWDGAGRGGWCGGIGGETSGLERVSATTFLVPGTYWMSAVNSATLAKWGLWRAFHGSATLWRAKVRGLWTVNKMNGWPSSM